LSKFLQCLQNYEFIGSNAIKYLQYFNMVVGFDAYQGVHTLKVEGIDQAEFV